MRSLAMWRAYEYDPRNLWPEVQRSGWDKFSQNYQALAAHFRHDRPDLRAIFLEKDLYWAVDNGNSVDKLPQTRSYGTYRR